MQNQQVQVQNTQNTELEALSQEERAFSFLQKKAEILIKGNILPNNFKNVGDVIILDSMSKSLNIPLITLAQQLYIVHGKVGMSGQLAIALINKSPKFDKPLMFEESANEVWGLRAYNYIDGEKVTGEWITDTLIEANNWNSNPKWQSMKNQMAKYRSAMWFARTYAPEILMGFMEEEELVDIEAEKSNQKYVNPKLTTPKTKTTKRRNPTKKEMKAQEFIEVNEITGEVFTQQEAPQQKPPKTFCSFAYSTFLQRGIKKSDLVGFCDFLKVKANVTNESELTMLLDDLELFEVQKNSFYGVA